MQTRKSNVRAMVMTAMLAAVSAVLMMLDFAMPIFPSFLKFDFSDLPALLGAFALGPLAGVFIELVKNLIHLLQTQTGGVGELANFLVGVALVLPAGFVYRFRKTRSGALLGMGAGVLTMAVAGGLANYFIVIPFYAQLMPLDAIIGMCSKIIPAVNSMETMILFTFVPFNLFKGVTVSLITYVVYKRLAPVLHGKR